MAAGIAEVLLLLRGNADGALRSIGEVESALGSMGKKTEATMAGFAKGTALAGAAIAATAVGVGAWAVDGAMKLDQSLTLIHTQAGQVNENLGAIKQSLYDMAPAVGQGPQALADALYHIESVGYTGADALDMLKVSAQGAALGHAKLDDVTNALVATVRSGIPGVNGYKDGMAQLNAIVGAGNMRMGELAASMSSGIEAAAATFGVSLQSVGAAMSYMTDRGSPPQETATKLRMSLSLLGAPAGKATKILTDLGLSSTEAADRGNAMAEALKASGVTTTQLADDLRKPDGIQVALLDLKTHLANAGVSSELASATISRAFGGGRSGAAIMSMYQNLDNLKEKYDQIGRTRGNFDAAWIETQKLFAFQVDKTKASLETLRDKLGDALMPTATRLMQFFNDHLAPALSSLADWAGKKLPEALDKIGQWFQDHQKQLNDAKDSIGEVASNIREVGEKITKVVLPALETLGDHLGGITKILGPLIEAWLIWKAVMVLTTAIQAVGALASTIGDLSTTGYIRFMYLRDGIGKVITVIWDAIAAAGRWVAETLIATAKMIASYVATAASAVINAAKASAAWLVEQAKVVAGWVATGASALASFVATAADAVVNAAKVAAAWIDQQASIIAAWTATKVGAIASFVATAAAATLNAIKVVAAWALAAFVSRAPWLVTAAIAIASFVATAVAAIVNAARVAAAWLAEKVAYLLGVAQKLALTLLFYARAVVEAIVAAIKTVAAWVAEKVAYLLGLAEKLLLTVAHYAAIVIAAVASAVATALAWVAEKVAYLIGLAEKLVLTIAHYAGVVIAAVASAVATAIAWVVEKVAYLIGLAIKLAMTLVSYALMAAAAVTSAAIATAAWLLSLGPFIIIGIAVVALVLLIITHFEEVKRFVGKVWDFIKEHWQILLAIFLPGLGLLIGLFVTHFDQIKGFVSGAWDFIKDHWQILLAIFLPGLGLVLGFVITHFSQIKDFIVGAFNTVKDKVMGVWDAITGKIQGAIDSIKGAIRGLTGALGSIPGIGGIQASLPHFAGGSGWLDTPMLAVIGDNPQGERVQTRAQYEAEQSANANRGGSGVTIHQTVNIAPGVDPHTVGHQMGTANTGLLDQLRREIRVR